MNHHKHVIVDCRSLRIMYLRETDMSDNIKFKTTWGNVDLQHGFITLAETKNGEKLEIPINNTLRESINKLPQRIIEKTGKNRE